MALKQNKIEFVDTTVRDGNQSIWNATGLRTGMILSIAPVMDRVGFKVLDFTTQIDMAVSVRWHKENPWEKIRFVSKAMPRTPLSTGTTGRRFMGFKRVPDSVVALFLERMAANGIRRVWILDALFEMGVIYQTARQAKEAGIEDVMVALSFSISPVHTDEYYAQKAQEIANCPDVNSILLKDQGGLLTPERVRTLVPTIQDNIKDLPLEIHAHSNTGLAPICYLEAIQLGVKTVHTAVPPLAYGSSQPSMENVLRNASRLGYYASIDEEAMKAMSIHFTKIAERDQLPAGAPVEYDVYYYEHQLPGGMVTTLKRNLSEVGMDHRLDQVLEEVIQVRKDLGYPIMVTPFSQFVATQATMNVRSGERYKIVPDGVIQYVAKYFGEPPAPIDQNVFDRIINTPKAKEFLIKEFPQPTIKELRHQMGIGPRVSDEEFLLRFAMGDKEVDEMLAAGPINTQTDEA